MSSIQILTTVLFCICFYLYCLVTGAGVLNLLKITPTKPLSILTGLMLVYALTELICMPFMQNKGDYATLFNILVSVGAFIFIICAHNIFIVRKDYNLVKVNFQKLANPLAVILLLLILIQTAVPVFFSRFDGDDAFYIAVSTSIQTTGRVFLNNPSIGLDAFAFPPNYRFTAYEILITVFSDLTKLDPVVMYHSVLPIIYLPMYYIANFTLADALFPGKNKKALTCQISFVLLIALLSVFDGYSNYLSSSFILLKPWMGKTCTINFCFIVFLTYFIKSYKSEMEPENYEHYLSPNVSYFILITLSLLAGAGTSAVGLYLLPVSYFTLALASLFTFKVKNAKKKDWLKIRLNYSCKAFISAIPSAIFLISFYIMLQQSAGMEQLNAFESNRQWIDDAGLMFKDSIPTLCLYLVSAFYFGFFGSRVEATLFFYGPIVLFLTFLNPRLQPWVGRYLTSMPLYWRFFWLLPLFPTISAFIVTIIKRYHKEFRWSWAMLLPLLLIFIPANFTLTDTKYYATENCAKIPNDISETVYTINEHINTDDVNKLYLLSLPHYNIYLRQYTGEIALVMPRMNFVEEAYAYAGRSDEFKIIRSLFTFDNAQIINGLVEKFKLEDLKKLGISMVIAPKEHPELNTEFKRVLLNDGDYLYIKNEIYK